MAPQKSRDSDSGSSDFGGYPNDIPSSDDDIPIGPFTRGHYRTPTFTVPNDPSVYTEATLKEVVNRFNLDVSKFNLSVTRTAPLKQELDRLVRLAPLGGKMSQVLTDETLISVGLGHHEHVEGMDFDASYVFKTARQKSMAPGASSPSGRKRTAVSSPTRGVPTPQNPSTSPQSASVDRVVGCVDIELKKSLEQKSLEESRRGLLMEISRVATFGETLYERAKDAERRAGKAEEEVHEKDVQVGQLVVEKSRTLVEIQKKDAELRTIKKALAELERKLAAHDVSQSDSVSIYKKTNEYKKTLAMYGSKSYLLALDHVKAWLRQSHPTINPAELEEFLSTLDVGSRSPGDGEM
ncbi:unnamed protein product [Fraxinus pennsylvanica]|uniref:Uncharacterized protein n=1 Tax=Fraxinus pennsylvanica TaxID=56036 RepID=A0AAD2A4U4_9LAMI|nr:unnamed protein product [Fraxinus pennsylvanica]